MFKATFKSIFRGSDFRKDYGRLGVLCALFSDVPVLAMTATASRTDIQCIQDSLGLKKCKHIIGNPNRKNIFYIARALLEQNIDYPVTIVYIPLRFCGFAYKLFEHVLGVAQYFPLGSPSIPANRLFAQFHAPQTKEMKEEILKQLLRKKRGLCVACYSCNRYGGGYTKHPSGHTFWPPMHSKGIFPRNWTCWQGWEAISGLLVLQQQGYCQEQGRNGREYA